MRFSRLALAALFLVTGTFVLGQPPEEPDGGMQPPGGERRGFDRQPPPMPLVLIALQKDVQTDLQLTDKQKKQIQGLDAKLRKSMGKRGQRRGDADRDARQGPPDSRTRQRGRPDSPFQEIEAELAKILSQQQMTRLRQIAMQLQCVRAILSKENVEKLNLTDEQIAKIKKLSRRDAKSVVTILTTEQQATWKELVGPEFKGKLSLGGPGGPGGPGGGPGGPRGEGPGMGPPDEEL